jgi:outer membrane protein
MKTFQHPLCLAQRAAGYTRYIFLCAALALLSFPLLAAEPKIAVIDLKKVFDDYYKTRLANAALEEEVAALRKDNKALMDDHAKAVDEYKKALDEANNQAVSAEEREKRKKEAEGKLIRVNDLRQSIEQFERTASTNLGEKRRTTQEKILKEIQDAINKISKAASFTLVLDSSTADPGRLPTVLYTNGEHDLTGTVLQQLNANAPPDLPKLDEKKTEEKK